MSRRMISGVVAIVLVCSPMGLVAQEREVGPVAQASVLERLGSLWNDLAAWLGSTVDGRCTIDPNGCPGGE
jgi:hypothetical protein